MRRYLELIRSKMKQKFHGFKMPFLKERKRTLGSVFFLLVIKRQLEKISNFLSATLLYFCYSLIHLFINVGLHNFRLMTDYY